MTKLSEDQTLSVLVYLGRYNSFGKLSNHEHRRMKCKPESPAP